MPATKKFTVFYIKGIFQFILKFHSGNVNINFKFDCWTKTSFKNIDRDFWTHSLVRFTSPLPCTNHPNEYDVVSRPVRGTMTVVAVHGTMTQYWMLWCNRAGLLELSKYLDFSSVLDRQLSFATFFIQISVSIRFAFETYFTYSPSTPRTTTLDSLFSPFSLPPPPSLPISST